MNITASMLRERVTIEQPVATADELGGHMVSWQTLATVFAEVKPIASSAREREVAAQVTAVAGYRVRLRSRTDVNASMRLVWKSHTLLIHSIHESEGALELLTYEEQV